MKRLTPLAAALLAVALPVAAEEKPAAKPAGTATAKPAASAPVAAAPAASPAAAPLPYASDEERTVYALGVAIARNLAPFKLSAKELEILTTGLSDGVLDREKKLDADVWQSRIPELARARQAAAAAEEKGHAQAFLEKAAAQPGAVKKPSGLVYRELVAGTGDSPTAADRVKVHYTGTLRDGTVFDSSLERGQPAVFPLGGVIKCWTEGVALMKVGGKAVLTCPSDIAYGDAGAGGKIKPGAALAFEVELLEVQKAEAPKPAAPAAPAAAPSPAPSPKKG